MTTKLERLAPQARCDACGSPKIVSVCHHCGRAACRDDSLTIIDLTGRPLSREFARLGMDRIEPYHCDACAHVVKGRPWLFAVLTAATALAGILVALADLVLGLSLFSLGVVLAVATYLADKRRVILSMKARPPLPVTAAIESVRVVETLRGSSLLDGEGGYRASVGPVEGEIEISMTLGRQDRDRLKRYLRRYRLADKGNVEFSAGFAALRGRASVEYVSQCLDQIDFAPDYRVIPLRGKVGSLPYFNAPYSRSAAPWSVRASYRLSEDRRVESMPIWLTPTLVPESDQRTLALDLQWTDGGVEGVPLTIERLEMLKLVVPLTWGAVETVERGLAIIGKEQLPEDNHEFRRTISWTQLSLSEWERASQRLTLRIRFENQIALDDILRGELEATFKNTLSGLEGVDIYHPLGGRRRNVHKREVVTRAFLDFTLSLLGIRYQDLRVVPDRKLDARKDDTDQLAGVIPDYETVTALTNAMSDRGYYVKRVIENPPRSGARASVVNRYWDIAGRRYDGVYPIDFHIVLTGEEFHKGEIRASGGNTKTRITVQGVYASDEMEQRIVREWESLHDLAIETLKDLVTDNWR